MTKLTLSDVFQVIDNHFSSDSQFCFVTDHDLAEIICEYIADNYGLIDEDMELDNKYKDYYVSLYLDEDGYRFYCETARGYDGEYKYCDAMNDTIDYFICNDMSEHDADKYLQGENCSWSWIDLVADNCEEENYDCEDNELENRECDCLICEAEQEIKDEECFCEECVNSMQNDAIEECLDIIFRGDACPSCLIDGVLRLAFKFKEIGRQEVKSEMSEFLED